MTRSVLLASVLIVMPVAGGLAQDEAATPNNATMRRACRLDYETHCSGSTVDAVRTACLRQYWVNLSQQCRAALKPRTGTNAP